VKADLCSMELESGTRKSYMRNCDKEITSY
jgi:hypothetical protein